MKEVEKQGVFLQVGFMRRFDPGAYGCKRSDHRSGNVENPSIFI